MPHLCSDAHGMPVHGCTTALLFTHAPETSVFMRVSWFPLCRFPWGVEAYDTKWLQEKDTNATRLEDQCKHR